MSEGKKPKPRAKRPRNPFAGRPQTGAGFHSKTKYSKKNRRRKKDEIEKGLEEDAS